MQPSLSSSIGQPVFELMARRMGVPQLFDFQKQAIAATLEKRDAFVVTPTGGGKSFCYIVPSLVLPGLVLVVSPLIALMRDQQRQLSDLAIPSLSFDSMLSPDEKRLARDKISQNQLKVLYVSPERLASAQFRELLRGVNIALIAIDEAHCVHQWGNGFRPEYRRLGAYLDELPPAPRMALTATVTNRERLEIIESLRMRNPELIIRSTPRHNLELILHRKGSIEEQKHRLLASIRTKEGSGKGIVYVSTRKYAEELFGLLRNQHLPVKLYHGGMRGDQRSAQQEAFCAGQDDIMVATKAFGMGINLPHIRFVLHGNMPCSVESYVQETGRAGRDGQASSCELFYGPRDYYVQKFLIDRSFPSETDLLKVVDGLRAAFLVRDTFREDELVNFLSSHTDLLRESLELTLDFLQRELVFQICEVQGEGNRSWARYVMLEGRLPELEMLLHARRQQVDWRYAKLKAMHQLIKTESCPRQFIEQYFD